MRRPRRWIVKPRGNVPDWLREKCRGTRFLEEILAGRGFDSPEQLVGFLDPDEYEPSAPESIPDVERASERIEAALSAGEKICVWGDFDVDGQTATTLLVSALSKLEGNVSFHIPVRGVESHGISLTRLERILNQEVGLLITCDTGITEHRAVDLARRRDVDVIITDHHDLGSELPDAHAVVNPKRLSGKHPAYHLPGVGVAYKVAQALLERAGREEVPGQFLDLVALGIVADLAVVRDDVRYLLQRGLRSLKVTRRPGLQALMEFAGVEASRVNEEQIGFFLAPRLNALGRLADANPVVSFLSDRDGTRAREFAGSLEGLNEKRKLLSEQVYLAAEELLERSPVRLQDPVLVLEGSGWPAGIVGLVANRLVERYRKPVVLFAIDDEGVAHGSARSIEGIDISASIAAQEAMLDSYGGHPMAAGLRMPADRIPAFRRQLSEHVKNVMGDQDTVPPLIVDAEIRLGDIGTELATTVERVAPFGPGNPSPVFSAQDLSIHSQRRIGRLGEHRALELVDGEGSSCRVLWWNAGGEESPAGRFDLAFHVREAAYRGEAEIQVEWVAAREHERASVRLRRPIRELRVVDLREVDDVHREVARLVQAGAQVWAEGMRVAWPARNRRQLKPGDELILWTAPPGIAELQEGLSIVEPRVVHFLGLAGDLDSLKPFLERLSGALKFAIRKKHGVVVLTDVSAALGHKPSTIREGIAWLATKGHVILHSQLESSFKILPGDGSVPNPDAKPHRLQASLSESAAFRHYLRGMEGDALRRYFRAVPAEGREHL